MELCTFIEPQQGASYDQQLAVALATEDGGLTALFRSDHYLAMGGASGLPGPTDSWITLAGLARETERIRLGTLVSAATFRWPGPFAISVAEVDAMSGGRVELGLGAAWFDDEHAAYGIPFPPVSERFDRLEEQLEIITGLWETPEGSTFDHDGRYYSLRNSPALPKPVQRPRPPIIIGGSGKRRTPAIAARFADEFNVMFPRDAALFTDGRQVVAGACERAGRDPSSLRWSAAMVVCCGADESEFGRRAGAIGRQPDELRASGAAGTVDEVTDKLGTFRDAGCDRVYLQVLDLDDLDHIAMIAKEVMPALR